MTKLNAKGVAKTTHGLISKSLWLCVLVPILAVSAYSLYYVARHLGVPPWIAWSMSTCFDGVALLAADYSLKYAQEGMSGSGPRTVVRVFALLAAFVQTMHARIGEQPPGSWVLWASLPIGAVTVYEIHIRWERRKALARAGWSYPAPLPAFGLATWVLFPVKSVEGLRAIVGKRKDAIVEVAQQRATVTIVTDVAEPKKALETKDNDAKPKLVAVKGPAHTPMKHIRVWAAENKDKHDWQVSDRARIPASVVEAYRRDQNGAAS